MKRPQPLAATALRLLVASDTSAPFPAATQRRLQSSAGDSARAFEGDEALDRRLQRVLSLNGFRKVRHEMEGRLVQEQARLAALQAEKDRLDAMAKAHPDRFALGGLGFLLSQQSLLFYWVYFRFDWGLVEPITYLLGYSQTFLALAFWYFFARNFTYNDVRSMLQEARQKRLYDETKFDLDEYVAAKSSIADLEKLLSSLRDLKDPAQPTRTTTQASSS